MVRTVRLFLVLILLSTAHAQSGTKAWYQVIEVKGTASKQTDLFETKGTKWRVRWKKPVAEDHLSITVYNKEGDPVDVISTKSTTNDESYMHKPGKFYLNINASGIYSIIVEDWR